MDISRENKGVGATDGNTLLERTGVDITLDERTSVVIEDTVVVADSIGHWHRSVVLVEKKLVKMKLLGRTTGFWAHVRLRL